MVHVKGFKSYEEYLDSEQWKKTKSNLTTNSCKICNKRGRTQIHHKTYIRVGNENSEDLIEVCGGCHIKIHRLVKAKRVKLYDASSYLAARIIRSKKTDKNRDRKISLIDKLSRKMDEEFRAIIRGY